MTGTKPLTRLFPGDCRDKLAWFTSALFHCPQPNPAGSYRSLGILHAVVDAAGRGRADPSFVRRSVPSGPCRTCAGAAGLELQATGGPGERRNEAALRRWKCGEWPRIKKSPKLEGKA